MRKHETRQSGGAATESSSRMASQRQKTMAMWCPRDGKWWLIHVPAVVNRWQDEG